MRLRANMSGVDKYFDKRERAVKAKEAEKNGEDLSKGPELGKARRS